MTQHDDLQASIPLRTRRLRLRRLDYADAPLLLRLDRDERVNGLLLDHHLRSLAQAAQLIAWMHGVYRDRPGLGVWHTANEHGRFVGLLSLMPIGSGAEVEIGARFLADHWGRFYAVEGGRSLCAHAFGPLALGHLVGLCHPQNRAPAAVLRRLGFSATGETMHFNQPALRFELRREDWRAAARSAGWSD